MIAPPDRQEEETYDLIVIGAGINGAGIARDAAMRGLRVLLLDKGDISCGTSSWSTRLIHGGLRYLEYGEVSLVRESLREREHLLHLSPHLVKPLLLMVPIYAGALHSPWMVRAGMIAYDILSYDRSVDHHHMLSRDETLRRMPSLNAQGLRGSATYYDAQVEYAERLVVENAISAQQHGATVRTYCRVDRLIVEVDRVVGVEYTDVLEGRTFRARGRFTLNVAGPWVDEVLRPLGKPMPRLIGGTKGTHLVVRPFPGAPREGMYSEAVKDRRPYFTLPWNDLYLIGTTDIRFQGDLDNLSAEDAEIEYLLAETNRLIPSSKLTRDSVLYTYTGVRPLPYVAEGAAGAITRRHILHDHRTRDSVAGLISIVGGKLTTYRSLAEQAVDTVYERLATRAPACPTGKAPLPGAEGDFAGFSAEFRGSSRLRPDTVNHLLRVYGTRARDVVALGQNSPDLLEVVDPDTGAIGAEVVFAVRHEMAKTLSDILLRRTMIGLGASVGLKADEACARVAQRHLGWDSSRADQELAAYRQYIQRFHPQAAAQSWGGRLGQQATQPTSSEPQRAAT